MTHAPDSNAEVATRFAEMASLLQQQGADRLYVQAYQLAAETIQTMSMSVKEILKHSGIAGLTALPTISLVMAHAIADMLRTGRWSKLDRLRGDTSSLNVFQSLPGVGPALARYFVDELNLENLEELEGLLKASDIAIAGVGRKRRETLKKALQERFNSVLSYEHANYDRPDDALVLRIDELYRMSAVNGMLHRIVPRRFNPCQQAWLPVMHKRKSGWTFSAMYSNSAQAHQLGKTADWVMVYFESEQQLERHCMVATAGQGETAFRRIVKWELLNGELRLAH